MAKINIVVPQIHKSKFSGGMLCVFEYAKGLRARHHDVNIIPLLPSAKPQWINGDIGRVLEASQLSRLKRVMSSASKTAGSIVRKGSRYRAALEGVRDLTTNLALVKPEIFSHNVQRALSLTYTKGLLRQLPDADVTLATSHETVLPVCLYGTGRKYYFAMHYEPYFSIDSPEPELAEYEASSSLKADIRIIANSSWLKAILKEKAGRDDVELCPNAIDHSIYFGMPKTAPLGREVKLISYGGRNAQWKGFREMAAGVRLARERLNDRGIRWLVYGASILPPSNSIAEYEALGFLGSKDLAHAYRQADILLSASWYESFPLFPIEAMACGLPVITTQHGTEEFAKAEVTAEIIKPRDPEEIASAIVRLVTQDRYRASLATNGNEIAKRFAWAAAAETLENIVLRRP